MDMTFENLPARPILGIRSRVRMGDIGSKIGELMPRLFAVAGPWVAGPPIARWHGWDGEEGEMEVAVPVRPGAAGQGEVAASTLPAGRALVAVHVGPYGGLAAAWKAVAAHVEQEGLTTRGAPWDEYIDDPGETPPEKLRTRIVWPVA